MNQPVDKLKNYIEIIYVDDKGLDHHVRADVAKFKTQCPAQIDMVKAIGGHLVVRMADFLRRKV